MLNEPGPTPCRDGVIRRVQKKAAIGRDLFVFGSWHMDDLPAPQIGTLAHAGDPVDRHILGHPADVFVRLPEAHRFRHTSSLRLGSIAGSDTDALPSRDFPS